MIPLKNFKEFLNQGIVKKQSPNKKRAEVSYMKELEFSENEVRFMNEVRYFRNGIKYYGKIFTKEYADQVVEFLKKIEGKL